uniref:Uncharacterized protein n=1 Tax=Ditylenchus dipsaci TaxID=166011 RepID=A0A915DCG4_9BILA
MRAASNQLPHAPSTLPACLVWEFAGVGFPIQHGLIDHLIQTFQLAENEHLLPLAMQFDSLPFSLDRHLHMLWRTQNDWISHRRKGLKGSALQASYEIQLSYSGTLHLWLFLDIIPCSYSELSTLKTEWLKQHENQSSNHLLIFYFFN